jgi:hypothetical protein
MQVSSADGARGQPNNRVVWLLNLRFSNVLQANVSDTPKHYSSHQFLLDYLFSDAMLSGSVALIARYSDGKAVTAFRICMFCERKLEESLC